MFRFKQFSVDQSGCAMKINTDGVLLGAMAVADDPMSVLDIGTGTGVIALMLAQRYTKAVVDAVEIDHTAAQTAGKNFAASPFSNRVRVHASSFEDYFNQNIERKYDLIVSNPPFYIDSLKSPQSKKTLAKHTAIDFFERLINGISKHLTPGGNCWMILPLTLSENIIELAAKQQLLSQQLIYIHSYSHTEPCRVITQFGFGEVLAQIIKFTIYNAINDYTDEYKKLLNPYFLAL